MVTINNMTARFTIEHSNRQGHYLSVFASTASLARKASWLFLEYSPSVFGFGLSDAEKARPCDVSDGCCHAVTFHHGLNVQRLYCDNVKASNQIAANFVVKVAASVGYALMSEGEQPSRLSSVLATFLLSTHCVLGFTDFPGNRFEETRIGDFLSVRKSSKGGQSYIYPDTASRGREWHGARQVTNKQGVPTAGSARDSNLLNFSFNGTTKSHATRSNTWYCQPITTYRTLPAFLKTLANRVALGFEARKARLNSLLFQATKERLERKIKSLKCVLLDASQAVLRPRQFISSFGKLTGLLKQCQRFTGLSVVANPLFKSAVIDKPRLIHRSQTSLGKHSVWANLVSESFSDMIWIGHAARVFSRRSDRAQSLSKWLGRLYFTMKETKCQ